MNHCYKVLASSNGTSSGSLIQHRKYGSKYDHLRQVIIDERKCQRMISNRESARRSRMKKHEYLDELIARVDLLKEENNQIVTNINMVIQLYLNVEAENSVLKAQIAELSHRLQSLKEINRKSSANGAAIIQGTEDLWNYNGETMSNVNDGDDFLKTWNFASWESAYQGLC